MEIDLAKNSFQACGVKADGAVVFNRAVSRGRLVQLLSDQSPCVVAMEACATSHHWGRVAMAHGHEVRLTPAIYVKPFVKRQKNDFADAAAIAEVASRPSMSFVAVKSAEPSGLTLQLALSELGTVNSARAEKTGFQCVGRLVCWGGPFLPSPRFRHAGC